MSGVIVGAFFTGMLCVGLFCMRKIKDTVSYFVADRKGNIKTITGSLLATTIGGSMTMGLAGLGYSKGLVGAWWMLTGVIGFLILAFWLAEKVRLYSLYTLPGILEKQYGGHATRVIASILIATAWLGIIAAQIIAAGKILSAIWPGHFDLLMIISGVVIVFYTFLGGQYSILRTDYIQSIAIIAGIFLCVVLSVPHTGGIVAMRASLPETFFSFPTSSLFTWTDLLTFLFFVGAAYLVGPDIYSRLFCSKSPAVAKKSTIIAAFIMIPLAFLIVLIGMTAKVLFPEIQPETAFPTLVVNIIPLGLNGLIIAALLAAVMSSADTCLLTATTIIGVDILRPITKDKLSEAKFLWLSRIGVIVIGAVSLLIALKVKGIISSLLLAYTVYSGGLVIPVLFGFFREKWDLHAWGAIASIIGGGGLGLFLKLNGHNDFLLLTFPVSTVLLFAGSFVARTVCERKRIRDGKAIIYGNRMEVD